ncbi:HPr(Ser) kinase/phosphatase [Mycoplasmopsis columboralis]|uniref:HPr kinase/phosphorylase n=1 Tax=Mycoplasmopsis columboralis TaxID=171282 RepID=A0A449B6M3_9BACT|nr:HPr(Ser) kinase/phosphatase [Mycoplasmopsis columboralis]VEU76261.1 HPr kinase/phosphorylase [Mycoplasmopsis columboralis]
MSKKMYANDIIGFFDLNVINSNVPLNNREILSPAIKRVGLELAENTGTERLKFNVIAWGTSESKWFDLVGDKRTRKSLEHVFSFQPPLVMLSKGMSDSNIQLIKEVASKYKVPVVHDKFLSSSYLTTSIGTYLNNHFAQVVQVHGCLMMIGGIGVLIVGPSGSGKSEAALDLIQKGHIFISDDAVLIKDLGNRFIGSSPRITQDFLEVRGIGPIDIKYTYGARSVASSSPIHLVVELVKKEEQNRLDRLGIDFLKYPIMGRSIKMIQVPTKEGGSVSSLIEAAVNAYLARHDGLNVIDKIEKRRLEDE